MIKVSRRKFSRYLGSGALAVGAATGLGISSLPVHAIDTRDAIAANIEKAVLAQYAYYLVPLLEPSHDRYRQVAQKVSSMARQVPPIAQMIDAGISALSTTDKGPWSKLSQSDRKEIVKQTGGTPFFNFLHWSTAEIVMREPGLWQQLGYEGSSIEHGGYLNRGFDDIDWLPVRKEES